MTPARTGSDPEVYQQGGVYTLRGPSQWKNETDDMCQNDSTTQQYEYRKASGIPERGFIWDTNSMNESRTRSGECRAPKWRLN